MSIMDESGGRYEAVIFADANLVIRRKADGKLIWAAGSVDTDPIPDPEPPDRPLPLLDGRLGFDGRCWTDQRGGRRRIPVGLHAGDLAMCASEGKSEVVRLALTDAAACGATHLRVWDGIGIERPHPFWLGRVFNPVKVASHFDHLIQFISMCWRDYGLALHLSMGDADGVGPATMEDYFRRLGRTLRDLDLVDAVCIREGLNEAYGTGQDDPRIVERWVRAYLEHAPETLWCLSAAAGGSSEEPDELRKWTPADQHATVMHTYRGGTWVDMARHGYSVTSGAEHAPITRNNISGEPAGVNLRGYYDGQPGPMAWVSSMDRPEDFINQGHRYAVYMAHQAMCRHLPTIMTSPGVRAEDYRFRDVPGVMETPRLMAKLPPDVMAFERLIHGGSSHAGDRVLVAEQGKLRCDHAIADDGRCVIAVYDDQDRNVPVERAWGGIVHTRDGADPLTADSGAGLPVPATTGAVLVGRML